MRTKALGYSLATLALLAALPTAGFRFKRGHTPPDAEEFDELGGTAETLALALGRVADLLVVKDGDSPGKWIEKKYYARGIGLVSENGELNLVSNSKDK